MVVKAWITFQSNAEKKEFIKILNESTTESEALFKVATHFNIENLSMLEEALKNFKEHLNKEAICQH